MEYFEEQVRNIGQQLSHFAMGLQDLLRFFSILFLSGKEMLFMGKLR